MTWFEEFEASLDHNLRERIAHDFPLLDKAQVEELARFLVRDDVKADERTWRWLDSQIGSATATRKFLELYWPTLARRCRNGHAGRHR